MSNLSRTVSFDLTPITTRDEMRAATQRLKDQRAAEQAKPVTDADLDTPENYSYLDNDAFEHEPERQPRERPIPCVQCRTPTMNHSAFCDGCTR